jgi:hypothetical protein
MTGSITRMMGPLKVPFIWKLIGAPSAISTKKKADCSPTWRLVMET